MWQQNYDPLAARPLSTLVGRAAAPHPSWTARHCAGFARTWPRCSRSAAALVVAIAVIGMPVAMAGTRRAARGGVRVVADRLDRPQRHLPLPAHRGARTCSSRCSARITGITTDRRLQLLLIAFCFGAFFEGAAGFGTPVAVTGAMLIGLGFPPLEASALSLIANTAPVAFGALGTPVIALQGVTASTCMR